MDGFLYKIKYCVVLEGGKVWYYVREMSFDSGNEKKSRFLQSHPCKETLKYFQIMSSGALSSTLLRRPRSYVNQNRGRFSERHLL